MTTPTNVQIIHYNNQPAFAVLPYDEYLSLIKHQNFNPDNVYLPHEVVGLQIKKGLSLIAAWRTFKGMSQQQLADKMGISQPAVAQLEKTDAHPASRTLQKIASALAIRVDQLIED